MAGGTPSRVGGKRGPVPARTETLIGHSAKEKQEAVTKIAMSGRVAPPNPNPEWGPAARALYDAALESGQSKYYEPTDWWMLLFTCREVDSYCNDKRPSAFNLQVLLQMFSQLLLTEAERRRVQVEIDRGPTEDPVEAAAQQFYKDMMS